MCGKFHGFNLNTCALSHYITLAGQKFHWMLFCSQFMTTFPPHSWIIKQLSNMVRYCTLCTSSRHDAIDMSCIPVLYTLFITLPVLDFLPNWGWAWPSSGAGVKSIFRNEWVAQPLKIAHDSGCVLCLGDLALSKVHLRHESLHI